jgi:hypothetical protein
MMVVVMVKIVAIKTLATTVVMMVHVVVSAVA